MSPLLDAFDPTLLPWGALLASVIGFLVFIVVAQRAAKGERVGWLPWVAGPAIIAGVAVFEGTAVLTSTALSAGEGSEWASAAAAVVAGDRALGHGLWLASAFAAIGAWVPAIAWRAAHGAVSLRDRELARSALAMCVGGGAIAASAGMAGQSGLPVAACLVLVALPALFVRCAIPRRNGRPDLRGRGAVADRAAWALVVSTMVCAVAGTQQLARAAGWQALLDVENGGDLGSLASLSGASFGLIRLTMLAGFTAVAGRMLLSFGTRRRVRSRMRPLGRRAAAALAMLPMLVAGHAFAHHAVGSDLALADAVSAHTPISSLPSVSVYSPRLRPAVGRPGELPIVVLEKHRLFSSKVGWLRLSDDESVATSLRLEDPAARVAMQGAAPAERLTTSPFFKSGEGTVHLIARLSSDAEPGLGALVSLPVDLRSASSTTSSGGLGASPAPSGADVVFVSESGLTVQGLLDRCVSAMADGAERCVLVPPRVSGLVQAAPGTRGSGIR